MNRTRLNYTSLGSVGATPFITGVLTAVSRLVGSLTTSVQHYGSLGRAMALDAVATGGIAIYGYASTVVYLADELIGTRNSLKYQDISGELVLSPTSNHVIHHNKYTPITQPMVLAGYESGTDIQTGGSSRVIIVPAQNREMVIPSASNSSGV